MISRAEILSRIQNIMPALILLAGLAWIWLSAAEPGAATAGQIPAPRQGFLAPDFSLPTPQGETRALSDLRGKPVILNVWASWCGPCRAEMPALEKVHQAYQEKGLVVLGLNAASQDSREAALAFAKELELTFPILLDAEGRVQELYEVRAFPTTYFIDRQGRIQEIVIGGPMAEALLRVRAEQLLEAD
jgi:peroxiredoxin